MQRSWDFSWLFLAYGVKCLRIRGKCIYGDGLCQKKLLRHRVFAQFSTAPCVWRDCRVKAVGQIFHRSYSSRVGGIPCCMQVKGSRIPGYQTAISFLCRASPCRRKSSEACTTFVVCACSVCLSECYTKVCRSLRGCTPRVDVDRIESSPAFLSADHESESEELFDWGQRAQLRGQACGPFCAAASNARTWRRGKMVAHTDLALFVWICSVSNRGCCAIKCQHLTYIFF
jgi:hypothetical protein